MMIKVLVLLIGGLAIGFILWWFFGKHATTTVTASAVDDLQQVDVEVKARANRVEKRGSGGT